MTGYRDIVFRFKEHSMHCGQTPRIMGILNVTPDSFSDGGLHPDPDSALAQARIMMKYGADIIDIGGESTRPAAKPVSAAVEKERVLPVIEALRREGPSIPISIDTRKPEVAEAAVIAGADIVNDISGLSDPEMRQVVAKTGAGCIVMHMRGTPETMQQFSDYDNLVADISSFFRRRLAECLESGIELDRIVLDPGIGFSKTAVQNLELIAATGTFRELGRPLLMGPSRKSFIGKITGRDAAPERVFGTAAAVALCIYQGADIVRVHDVPEMRDTSLVAAAIRDGEIS